MVELLHQGTGTPGDGAVAQARDPAIDHHIKLTQPVIPVRHAGSLHRVGDK